MGKKNKAKEIAVFSELGREGYEASIMRRMSGRSGAYSPKGAPGNALEILANDKENFTNIFKPGTVTKLTKSPVAKQVDAVTMKGNKVVERIQYKDTTSASGIRRTLKQAEDGKYRQAQLRGTKETAEKFNEMAEAKGISKRMRSTGISSDTTKRIGDKFTGQRPKIASIKNAVKTSAKTAVGLTAGIEVAKSIANGDTIGECTGHVVSKSAESAITVAASTIAAETTFGAAASILATSAIPVVGPLLAGGAAALGTGVVVGGLMDGVFDDIGEGIGDFIDDVGEGIGVFFDAVGEGIGDTIDSIDEAFSNICYNIGSFFDNLFL